MLQDETDVKNETTKSLPEWKDDDGYGLASNATTTTTTTTTQTRAILKLQAFCRGCMTRQRVSEMIAEIIQELRIAVGDEETAPLAIGDDDDNDNDNDDVGKTNRNDNNNNNKISSLDSSFHSITSCGSSAVSLTLVSVTQQQQDQQQDQPEPESPNTTTGTSIGSKASLSFSHSQTHSMSICMSALVSGSVPAPDPDPMMNSSVTTSQSPNVPSDYSGAIESKIELYLESPKKLVKRSVANDIFVPRGSVQAAASLFSPPPLHDQEIISPKRPKQPWNPKSPLVPVASTSIMDRVNKFSQSLSNLDLSEDFVKLQTPVKKKKTAKTLEDTISKFTIALNSPGSKMTSSLSPTTLLNHHDHDHDHDQDNTTEESPQIQAQSKSETETASLQNSKLPKPPRLPLPSMPSLFVDDDAFFVEANQLEPSDEPMHQMYEDYSAVKIQAMARGYIARKMTAMTKSNLPLQRSYSFGSLHHSASTKIQASARGYLVRKANLQDSKTMEELLDCYDPINALPDPSSSQRDFDQAVSEEVQNALAARQSELVRAATTIQALIRGVLVRKFDLVAMKRVIQYLKEHQELRRRSNNNNNDDDDDDNYNHDGDDDDSVDVVKSDDEITLDVDIDNNEEEDEDEDEYIPEPKEEELDKAWSILQKNRSTNNHLEDESIEQSPCEPISVRELLSTWDWLKAKERSREQNKSRQLSQPDQQVTQSDPVNNIDATASNQEILVSSSHKSQRPESEVSIISHVNSNIDVDRTTEQQRPTTPSSPSHSPKVSHAVPPRIGDLVAFYTWLEHNRLFQGKHGSLSEVIPSKNAAAEIQQAREEAKKTMEAESIVARIDETTNLAKESDSNLSREEQPFHQSLDDARDSESPVDMIDGTNEYPNDVKERQDRDSGVDTQTVIMEPPLVTAAPSTSHSTEKQKDELFQQGSQATGPSNQRPTFSIPNEKKIVTMVDQPITGTMVTQEGSKDFNIKATENKVDDLLLLADNKDDVQFITNNQESQKRLKDIVRTGKVNFDEVFELWTWLELNDFDMTKFKKRAVEMGIIDNSVIAKNVSREKRMAELAINKLEKSDQSEEESLRSRFQANIQLIEQNVLKNESIGSDNRDLQIDKISYIQFIDEDLSGAYKSPVEMGKIDSTNLFMDPKNQASRVNTGDIGKAKTPVVEYINEDLSSFYRPKSDKAKKLAKYRWSNIYIERDHRAQEVENIKSSDTTQPNRGKLASNVDAGPRTLVRDNEEASSILYLDEDLSNVYKGQDKSPRSSNQALSKTGYQFGSRQNEAQSKTEMVDSQNESQSYLEYIDEDLSSVYAQNRRDGKSQDVTSRSRDKGVDEIGPRSDSRQKETQSKTEMVESQNESQSYLEYIDEDLSSVYTENQRKGEIVKPTLKAMVKYWEFSKNNAMHENDSEALPEETEAELQSAESSVKSSYTFWETNPSSNRMLSTLKWLDRQGINLDDVTDQHNSSDTLKDELELSATELNANAAKAAPLKKQDLANTIDWLTKHGFNTVRTVSQSSEAASETFSLVSDQDPASALDENKNKGIDPLYVTEPVSKCQTKADLTAALRWLQQHGYEAKESSTATIAQGSDEPTTIELDPLSENDKYLLTKQRISPNKPGNIGGARYDANVLHSLSWLQKHGFDLDKSIHVEKSDQRKSSEPDKLSSRTPPVGTEVEAPTMDSMMDALATIDDENDHQLVSLRDKEHTTQLKRLGTSSSHDMENALKWLSARGIGKPKKASRSLKPRSIKPSKDPNESSQKQYKSTPAPDPHTTAVVLDLNTKTVETAVEKKKEKKRLSASEMSSALKWLNRKGFSVTAPPQTSIAPKSTGKTGKKQRNSEVLSKRDQEKSIDKGNNSEIQPSENDMELALRFFNIQESKKATLSQHAGGTPSTDPVDSVTKNRTYPGKQNALIATEKNNDVGRGSKKFTETLQGSSNMTSGSRKPPKNTLKTEKSPGNLVVKVSPFGHSDAPESSSLVVNSKDKATGISLQGSKNKNSLEESTKTPTKSSGRSINRTSSGERKGSDPKSGDQKKEKSTSKRPSTSTADMNKTLKWLQTKASMKSPMKSPKPNVRSSTLTEKRNPKIPPLPPLDTEEKFSPPGTQVEFLPVKKSSPVVAPKSEDDYQHALAWLNNKDSKEIADAIYFKKLDNMLPKRSGQNKEARAREMAKALAWVKKQGILDAGTTKKAPVVTSVESNKQASNSGPAFPIYKASVNRKMPEEKPIDRNGMKSQTTPKKLTSIKDIAKQAIERQKALDEKQVASAANQRERRNSKVETSDPSAQDFENALEFVVTKQAGGDVMSIQDAVHFKKLDNMLPKKINQAPEDRAREMLKMLGWLRKKGKA